VIFEKRLPYSKGSHLGEQQLSKLKTTLNDPCSALNPFAFPERQGTTIAVQDKMFSPSETNKAPSPNKSFKFRLIALDLDGTLLQSNHRIADVQVEYLQQLCRQVGVRICIATGRAPQSVYEHVQKLALRDPVPVVCSNGARGFLLKYQDDNKLDIEEVFYTPVDRHVVETTIELAKKMGYCVQYYLENAVYANPINDEHQRLLQAYESVTQCTIQRVDDDFASLMAQGGHPSKLLVRFGNGDLQKAYHAFADVLCPSSSTRRATIIQGFLPRSDWFLEILHPNVNKGQGLQQMCKALKISLDETVAFGDGTNDVEFLTLAGWGVAMKNAHKSLQNVANATIEWTNDQHGVTKTIEQMRKDGHFGT
jgi:Cof subfamily protein (haloacid dehalogenase superfamily)